MRVLVVMDPLERLNLAGDTSVGFISAALRRGHQVFESQPEHLSLFGSSPIARARPLFGDEAKLVGDAWAQVELQSFDTIWMRKDPPVDERFLQSTYFLDYAAENSWVINPPAMLRGANEKLYALNCLQDTPETHVCASVETAQAILSSFGAPMIAKPLDGHGGAGVFLVTPEDRNQRAIFEALIDDSRGPRWIVLQRYLPEAQQQGDKRVLFIDGEARGVIARRPRHDDHRANLHVGGTAERASLSEAEEALCRRLGAALKRDGIFFAGADLIGGQLIEVNLTSPTGIRELKNLGGPDLGLAFVEAIERKLEVQR